MSTPGIESCRMDLYRLEEVSENIFRSLACFHSFAKFLLTATQA